MVKKDFQKGEVLFYILGFVLVSLLNIGSRFLSTIGFSSFYGVEFDIEMVLGVLPVLSFSEANINLFRTISSLSLIVPAVVMFLMLLQRFFRKTSKVEWKRGAEMNIWLFGLFLTLIQYGIAMLLDERIQFANDWRGLVVVILITMMGHKLWKKDKEQKNQA